ncbi:bifunctional 2-C-methyl-D-erythritol 4-phosphate cytidylyltransferase/2-C-methyl-D-erythritol 2,4-cyclodiphosphate synthase [Parvibaculaceae bacterium PLY_AMNH_Bact1]|nr:bifunctional 2-C-methyl-D-erythritol 4-phosphate cytidylyltransferase/2-C-methyl-D-erythritol 2,4-cyclodiphosphate synthase [Parvibaculaceae bacterium PLY_AMNH_Bact1]
MRVVALIVAAGRGTRAGDGLPKQYRPVGGVPILARTLSAFCRHRDVENVLAVIHPDDHRHYERCSSDLPKLLPPAAGSSTRQASVLAGLEALADINPSHVLIHDGARPFAAPELIGRVVAGLQNHEGVLPSLAVTDTLREQVSGIAGETVDRSTLVRAQTPQGFAYKAILEAHRTHQSEEFTDDVALALRTGVHTHLVEGSEDNFKVTTPEDFDRAERFLSASHETRSGSGFDVHRFTDGDQVTLCGLSIPHSQSLLGHSDADVGLHAITDALLGAIGAGDIGDHFPPSDPEWKGAPSRVFLEHAATLLSDQGGRISNLDVTLICEAPKIGPHRQAMRSAIAEIVGVSPDRVSVKATTTEGLGFTGRSEGIAAQALVTVTLPRSAGVE